MGGRSRLELERLWAEGSKPRTWIVRPLIAEGDQIILAGEPKSGKSLLASQLCLEIAKGPGVLSISRPGASAERKKVGVGKVDDRNPTPGLFEVLRAKSHDNGFWRVLYVSFEMRPEVMWARTSQQAEGMKIKLLLPKPAPALGDRSPSSSYEPGTHQSAYPFFHLFEIQGKRSLGIVADFNRGDTAKPIHDSAVQLHAAFKSILARLRPDLVIFDSLSQLHYCDENSNAEMRDVLQQLRTLCCISSEKTGRHHIAHLIIHHTRKETGDQKYAGKTHRKCGAPRPYMLKPT